MDNPIDMGLALIRRPDFEGLRLRPYLCPAGCWTIGIGCRFLADGSPVSATSAPITEAQAEQLARGRLALLLSQLRRVIRVPVIPAQEAALLSWSFNIGIAAARASTLLRLLNAGRPAAASDEFPRWNKATVGGRLVVLPGLVRRRAIERLVFLGEWPPAEAEAA